MKKRLNYLLLVLCLLVASACKNGVSTTASGKDEGAGGCEGEKAKAILWVDYKKGRSIPAGVASMLQALLTVVLVRLMVVNFMMLLLVATASEFAINFSP